MTSHAPYPLRFRPVLKQTIWGGTKLGTLLGKPIGDDGDYAESWEVVDHGSDQSVIENGELAGKTLGELVRQDSQWLLGEGVTETSFPLLLKYLDCNRDLSVQVHPDDTYGATMEVPDRGKTEAWYVVQAEPGSLIYAGLKSGVDRETLGEAMAAGQTDSVLHSFHPSVGDCVFIPAGTVHALGAGLVIAEIQQSSDTTFRLFDWNRVDALGKSRPLHIQQSLEVTDYVSGPVAPIRGESDEIGLQELVRCDKFLLSSLSSGNATVGEDDRPVILTVPEGGAQVSLDGETIEIRKGETLLLPAALNACEVGVSESGCLLVATLPPAES